MEEVPKNIDWKNLFKIKISNSSQSMQKHEIVKLLLVMKLMEYHRRQKFYIRIYTEFPVIEGIKTDVYYENIKRKEVHIFEIQNKITTSWKERIKKAYQNLEIPFFNSVDYHIIPLEECPDSIPEINEWLEEFLV